MNRAGRAAVRAAVAVPAALFALSVVCGVSLPAAAQAAPPPAATAAGLSAQTLLIVAIVCAAAAVAGFAMALHGRRRHREIATVIEAFPTMRLVTTVDGTPTIVTRGWRDVLGAAEGSLETLAAMASQTADGAARFARLRDAARDGENAQADLRLGLPGMDWCRIDILRVDGDPPSIVWSIENVSDRYELERVIQREQEKLIEFVENAPLGFYSVNAEGRFLFVNQTFAEWVGRSEAELTNGAFALRDLLPDHLLADCVRHSPLPGIDGDGQGETSFISADGESFDAYITQTVVPDERGGDLLTRSLVRHLSAERSAAEAVRLSEERFHRFFADAPVGIALLDGDARVTECNAVFAAITGVGPEATVGRSLAEFVRAEDAEMVADWLRDAAGVSEPPPPIEVRMATGREMPVSLYVGRVGGPEGASGMIVHVFDLFEQKRLEAQFFQSQKMEMVGQLAGGVAHDFNNLLTAMIGFCDLLLLRHTPRDQSFADIQQIKQNANRAANLVRQLLAFSRQQTLQPRVLDMTDVLSETSHLLRRLIGANIQLNFYHGRDLWLVKADQGQFEQVVINLAVNARDAMTDGGTLTIRTGNVFSGDPRLRDYKGIPDGDYVLLEMQDTGTGIPDDVVDKIFEPFFTTKEVGAGTGLGLSTVYGIVKQTGGYVFVDSETGKGARFSIYLPRYREEEDADAVAEEQVVEEQPRDLTGAGTVMLVEDEDAVRLFGARALRNKGYNVIEAKNGEGALDILNGAVDGMATTVDGEKIDLLITDVVMPGVDGPELVREVRQRYPGLKVIFISGYTEDTFRQKLGEGEEVEFLSKPFSLQQLAGKVKEVMNADGGGKADAA